MAGGIYVTTVLGAICVVDVYRRVAAAAPPSAPPAARVRLLTCLIRTLGVVVWPALLCTVVRSADARAPALVPALLWTSLLWWTDSYLMTHSSERDATPGPLGLRIDPNLLTGLAFGLSTLVGSRPDGPHSSLFLYAILGCFLVVLPSHSLPRTATPAVVFDNVQKVVFHWCIGLLIAAIALTRGVRAERCA